MPISNTLNDDQWAFYLKHGEVLSKYPVAIETFAREAGVTRHFARTVAAYAVENGPPPEHEERGAWHLVVGDAHAKPSQDLRRFRWLGRAISRYGREAMGLGVPFRVINIGDWFDMPSLSSYDKGKGKAELRRYKADIEAGHDAYALVKEFCDDEVYSYADLHALGGNHGEGRCSRFMNDNPELIGLLHGPQDTAEAFGWEYTPYLEWCRLDGVGYCHYMQNPNSGTAVSGVNVARSLLLKGHRSVTVGHNHRLDTYQTSDAFGNPIQTLSCGCFFEDREDYAGQSNDKWWRGLVLKTDVKDGAYNLTTLSMESIRRSFGEED